MILLTHLAGGYLVLKVAKKKYPKIETKKSIFLLSILIGSIFPDIDLFTSKYLVDHHSFLHTPLFWILIFIFLYFLFKKINRNINVYLILFILGVMTHLFLDWFGARSTGVRLFYPFYQKDYSLFPLQLERGKVEVLSIPGREYLTFYMENWFLFITEILICIAALILSF